MRMKTPLRIGLSVGGGILIIIVIVIATSFPGLEYYEMGFPLSRTTGYVNTDKLYFAGRYLLGPDKTFKSFPKNLHIENFHRISVYTSDRLEIVITTHFQYYLRPHQVAALHERFDIHYRPILKSNALDALKNTAIFYTTREYIRDRERIEKALEAAVRARLSGKCCEKGCTREGKDKCLPDCKNYDDCTNEDFGLYATMVLFQLTGVSVPRELAGRFTNSLLLIENNVEAQLSQQASVIRKETDQRVATLRNTADRITQAANANSSLINTLATAEAKLLIQNARTEGLKYLYKELAITNEEHKTAFEYLRTLKGKEQLKLAIDFQSYIAGDLAKT